MVWGPGLTLEKQNCPILWFLKCFSEQLLPGMWGKLYSKALVCNLLLDACCWDRPQHSIKQHMQHGGHAMKSHS